jgi:hypothetical protein
MSTTAQKTLEYKNWTGCTLAQLIEVGRVTCPQVILEFVNAANPAKEIADYKTNQTAAHEIAASYELNN